MCMGLLFGYKQCCTEFKPEYMYMYVNIILYCVYTHVLGWPKSSFGIFHKLLGENSNERFGQPNAYIVHICICNIHIY